MHFYEISSGKLFKETELLGTGYAGHGEGRNNPDAVRQQGVGPLPPGVYKIGPAFDHDHLGPCVMRLTQVIGQSYGRDAFFLHGDNASHPGESSDGCVVQGPSVRTRVAASADSVLVVVANLPGAMP